MAKLAQLNDGDSYRPCDWDLKADPAGRRYWVDHFCEHFELLAAAISEEYPDAPAGKLAEFRAKYLAAMRALDAEPARFERIDILYMDELRNELQAEYGFHDPYRGIKSRDNGLALDLLPGLLAELDATTSGEIVEKLIHGLMAGNLFDLGALAAVKRYGGRHSDFPELRATRPPRPWLIDGLDAWRERWSGAGSYRHVAFFVDNAGSDVCLGCLSLTRWMLRMGSRVTLVANSGPTLNDVTAPEVRELLDKAAELDVIIADKLASGQLSVAASGASTPLIDLTRIAGGCVDAIADADLIILHGMGRAIESNARAAFSCDSLRSAVLKDAEVARRLGGRLFDCVFRFEAAV